MKLMDDALADHRQALPGELGIERGNVGGGPTSEGGELGLARAADAPDVLEIHQWQPFPPSLLARQVADAAQVRCTLCDLVGQLGQALRRA